MAQAQKPGLAEYRRSFSPFNAAPGRHPADLPQPLDGTNRIFQDDLLDHMTGSWTMTGSIIGAPLKHQVDVHWILNHQFLEVHELDTALLEGGGPAYEAMPIIGYDNTSERCRALDRYLWRAVSGNAGLRQAHRKHDRVRVRISRRAVSHRVPLAARSAAMAMAHDAQERHGKVGGICRYDLDETNVRIEAQSSSSVAVPCPSTHRPRRIRRPLLRACRRNGSRLRSCRK